MDSVKGSCAALHLAYFPRPLRDNIITVFIAPLESWDEGIVLQQEVVKICIAKAVCAVTDEAILPGLGSRCGKQFVHVQETVYSVIL